MMVQSNDKIKEFKQILHEIAHYLPSQMTLKDFVHHNSLHAFQHESFYEGIFRASKIFGFKVTLQLADYRKLFQLGRIREEVIERIIIDRKSSSQLEDWSRKVLYQDYDENGSSRVGLLRADWKGIYGLDMDTLVHPLLYRILAAYLDQGISIWNFPKTENGFLSDVRAIEQHAFTSLFQTKQARKLFLDPHLSTLDLLEMIVGDATYFKQYMYDTLSSHRGWSGMVAVLEEKPEALLFKRNIHLQDLLHFELCLELDTLFFHKGNRWKPLSATRKDPPIDILAPTELTELDEVLKIWQDAFEWSYYDDVFKAIRTNMEGDESKADGSPKFQAVFCIDERECSLRRHIEWIEPECQTFGAPGFFGVEFYYKQAGTLFLDKLCPAPVTPKYLIQEINVGPERHVDLFFDKRNFQALQGLFNTFIFGAAASVRLLQAVFRPKMSPSISDAFSHMSYESDLTVFADEKPRFEDGLQIGFTLDEMVIRVENMLRNIGLIKGFAPIVYMMAHGSSSANNPHHGAHDCGACSGRPGSVNARVFCKMANSGDVRRVLKTKGILIPSSTVFIPAMHDTASDEIGYFDDKQLTDEQEKRHHEIQAYFEQALDLNAKERSRRFASIQTQAPIKQVRKAILDRSVSLFEPRPELGHGTNSLAIIGRRSMTRGLFMDRRAFLNSYDYSTDPEGKYLAQVMAPIGVVCGGINLEYYFSRVDNMKLGCGTKLPHNVVGLLGVSNSPDGDLRPGLPWQMIEPHDPVRLMVIVEHFPEVVLKAIRSNEAVYEWYAKEWVHIAAVNPETREFYYFRHGQFVQHHTELIDLKAIQNVHHLFDEAPEMMTNHITHATFENLPIYQLENSLS